MWLMNGAPPSLLAGLGNVPTNWNVVGTGDFNGDGKTDLLWQDNLGNTAIWLMNGTAVTSTGGLGNIPTNWSMVGTGDFNGDGMTDIVWRDTAGDAAIWLMNGATISSAGGIGTVPTTWSIALVGDYNGDGNERSAVARQKWQHSDVVHERCRDFVNRLYRQHPDELDRAIGQC